MTRETAFSLPGTGEAEMITVSPALDRDRTVVAVRHARQCGERFALAPGGEDDDLVGRQVADLVGVDDVLGVDVEVAQLARDAGVLDHAATRDHDLATTRDRRVAHLLESMDVARERGDDDALRGVLDDLVKSAADLALGAGVARGCSAPVESLMSRTMPSLPAFVSAA